MTTGKNMRKRASSMRQRKTASERDAKTLLLKMNLPVFEQVVIGDRYILDFVGQNRLFVLEIDGKYHDFQKQYDHTRDSLFEFSGFVVVRIPNKNVSFESLVRLRELPVVGRQIVRNHLSYAKLLSKYSPAKWPSLALGKQE